MTSGGNIFNYFPENQLTKFSAVLQLKMKPCFSRLLCCFVEQYSLYIEGNLAYSTEMEVKLWNAEEELCSPNFLISVPKDFCNHGASIPIYRWRQKMRYGQFGGFRPIKILILSINIQKCEFYAHKCNY